MIPHLAGKLWCELFPFCPADILLLFHISMKQDCEETEVAEMKRAPQSFLKGAAVLVGAVAVVKVLGAFFKIPLSWILTPVGSAYFGSAYSLYFPIYSLAAAGFPTAVARMVSAECARGRYQDVRSLHSVSVRMFTVLGFCAFALMMALSWPYANLAVRTGPDRKSVV